MATSHIDTFVPRGRRIALATGAALPEQDTGVCLFADISGFTPLTESLQTSLGPQQGAEALTEAINKVFEALIAQVHRHGGDVLGFAGDAISCWFPDRPPASPRPEQAAGRDVVEATLACALAMQGEMAQFSAVPTPDGKVHALTMKVGIAYGPVRRFRPGAADHGCFDVLVGATVDRMAAAEHHANKGETICAPEVPALAGPAASWGESREGFRPLLAFDRAALPPLPPVEEIPPLPAEAIRPCFPPALFDWLSGTQGQFMAELRPVISAFVRFERIDFEHDPQAGDKLDQYVTTAQRLAAQYGGNVIRLDYGDKGSVLHVVFGAPVAHEDDEVRAVGWALEQQAAVREMPFITGQTIGMSRGQVYAGALGASTRRGYTLMGDEVNASARLMQACQPGQTLVSQRIMQAAQKRFMFHQFPNFQVKGKDQTVLVATPVAPLPAMQQLVAAGPLIGRQQELAQLIQSLDRLLAGQGGIIRLAGREGVGKSRLVAELVQQAMQHGVRTMIGSGQGTGQDTPYLPWREILRTLFGVQSAWPAAQQAMQIQTMVQWINPEWLPRVPLFGDLLGLDIPDTPLTAALDPRLRQQSLFALLGDLLARMAAQQPLLLLVEDCHWLDEASGALLAALGWNLAEARVLLIVTHRPPLDPDRPILPTLEETGRALVLDLSELTPEGVRALVTARLGGDVPAEILALIEERAQGNPLFVEELAETLRETSRLQQVAGRWVLVGSIGAALKLPDTIQGVVLARLDLLDESSKTTLKVASVVGRTFEVQAVAGVHPAQIVPTVLDEQLATLQKRDLLLREVEAAPPAYRFKHNVAQEVTYAMLLYAQRRELHRAVAAWYERTYGGSDDGASPSLLPYLPLLVRHYHGAEDPNRERHYARLAGEQAAGHFANTEALRYLGRALELTPEDDLPARYPLIAARERVHDLLGDREEQAQDLAALQSLADALGERARQTEVALRRGGYAEVTGDYQAAIAAAQEAIALAEAAGDVPGQAAGRLQWGRALWQQGDLSGAQGQEEAALAQAEQAALPRLQADCHLNLGLVAHFQGRYGDARGHQERARGIYHQIGNQVGEIKALNNLGNTYQNEGDAAGARDCYEQILGLCREIGWRWGESMTLSNLGIVLESQGDYAAAVRLYEESLRLCRQIGNRLSESHALNNLGLVLLNQGDYADARERIEQSLRICRDLGNRRDESLALSNLALISHLLGEQEAAAQYSRQSLAIAQELGDRPTEAEALTHMGHALADLGQAAAAAAAYRQAAAIRSEIGEQTMAVESLAGLARAVLQQDDRAAALAVVEEILAHIEAQGLDGAYEPLRIHLTCYQVLRVCADPRASAALARAYRLLHERAGRIGDEALRRSFLENVAAHRALAAALEQDPEAQSIVAQVPGRPAEEVVMVEAVAVPAAVPAAAAPAPAVPEPVPASAAPAAPQPAPAEEGKKDKRGKGQEGKKEKRGKKQEGKKEKKGKKGKKQEGKKEKRGKGQEGKKDKKGKRGKRGKKGS